MFSFIIIIIIIIIIIYYFAFNNRNTLLHQTLPWPPQTHPFSTVAHCTIQPQQQIKLLGNLTNIFTANHTHWKTHRQHTNHNPQPATHHPKNWRPTAPANPQQPNPSRVAAPTNPQPSTPTNSTHPTIPDLCPLFLTKTCLTQKAMKQSECMQSSLPIRAHRHHRKTTPIVTTASPSGSPDLLGGSCTKPICHHHLQICLGLANREKVW
jgi:hypothetical protein